MNIEKILIELFELAVFIWFITQIWLIISLVVLIMLLSANWWVVLK